MSEAAPPAGGEEPPPLDPVHAPVLAPVHAPVLALVRDLLFASRISGAARVRGANLKVIRDPQKLVGEPGRLLFVDLNLDGAIESAAAWGRASGLPVIGFVFHTDAKIINQARAAGIARVIARGQFAESLHDLF